MIAALEDWRVLDCEQNSPEWIQARIGMLTSSRIAAAIAKRKRIKEGVAMEELAIRWDMKVEIVSELLSNSAADHYVSPYMNEGREKEPLACAAYENRFGMEVDHVGFIYHSTIKRAGCSPDGLIGQDGMVEFKCPKISTHIQYLIDNKIPNLYLPQLCWQLACDETRSWNDFVSFCPELPKPYKIFRKRLERTPTVNDTIRRMEAEAVQFLSECDAMIARLKEVAG